MSTKHRLLLALIVTIVITLVLMFSWLPSYLEKSRNLTIPSQYTDISHQADQLHESLFIADMHSDSLLWNRNLAKKSSYGHVDIPRLIEGNVALQVFSVVTKTPKNLNLISNRDDSDNITLLAIAQLWPARSWFNLFERAHYQASKLTVIANNPENNFHLISNQQDFNHYLQLRKSNSSITAGILSLEGAHALNGQLENIDRLYELGYRIIGFTHFFDNTLGGSAHGTKQGGITKFGKQVLKRMHELKMFIDLSQASPKLTEDIFSLSKRPLLVTHTGIQAVCASASNRNLTDKQIKQVAATKGLIGIGFWPTATCNRGIPGIVASIRYVGDLVGFDYVGLGSDFDGNVSVPFTSSDIKQLTQALIHAELSTQQIRKVMGGNLERIFKQYLPD